jgi:hypothetical protein
MSFLNYMQMILEKAIVNFKKNNITIQSESINGNKDFILGN